MSDVRKSFTIVLGYDGSESARRGVERVRQLAVERPTVVVVAVAPEVRSAGLGTDLVGRVVDTDLFSRTRVSSWRCEETRRFRGVPR